MSTAADPAGESGAAMSRPGPGHSTPSDRDGAPSGATGAVVQASGTDLSPDDDGRGESSNQRLDRNWQEMLQELRVMQTGIQILTGFLLTLPFQSRFEELDDLLLHIGALLAAARHGGGVWYGRVELVNRPTACFGPRCFWCEEAEHPGWRKCWARCACPLRVQGSLSLWL